MLRGEFRGGLAVRAELAENLTELDMRGGLDGFAQEGVIGRDSRRARTGFGLLWVFRWYGYEAMSA